ncbi:hypothetical protein Pmani_001588 [Petrolisthes manimaculis]|uniref:TMC domain-containing protein n=1 Tax=Petrolisthes manimaculis TaxID=1843537 RepID=A0AAE1QKC5_9EUCA|nr:hypothetical protein Pmani_001588 [Petrolisthes manimaculis]
MPCETPGTSSPIPRTVASIMSVPLQDNIHDNQSQPTSNSSRSPILTRCHHAFISVLKMSLWVIRMLRGGPRQPEEREGDEEDVEEAKTGKSMRRTDERKGDDEDLNVERIAVSLGTVERKGEEEVEQTKKTVKSLRRIEERQGHKEKMEQRENGEREGEKKVEQVSGAESTQWMKHSHDMISLASSFSSTHSITPDTASINTSSTENSEVCVKEAEEELRKVKEMEAPMIQRRWRMVNLRHQREEANNTNKSRWYSPTLAHYFIQKGKLAWKKFRESVQISKRPTNKINGRFGSSGVAVFRLAKDLLLLNLFVCLVLHSCLYIPILLFSHHSHHWETNDWMWGWAPSHKHHNKPHQHMLPPSSTPPSLPSNPPTTTTTTLTMTTTTTTMIFMATDIYTTAGNISASSLSSSVPTPPSLSPPTIATSTGASTTQSPPHPHPPPSPTVSTTTYNFPLPTPNTNISVKYTSDTPHTYTTDIPFTYTTNTPPTDTTYNTTDTPYIPHTCNPRGRSHTSSSHTPHPICNTTTYDPQQPTTTSNNNNNNNNNNNSGPDCVSPADLHLDRCPKYVLTKDDPCIKSCSLAYLDHIGQMANNNTLLEINRTLWISEVLLGKGRLEFSPLFLGFYPAVLTIERKGDSPMRYQIAAVQIVTVVSTLVLSLVMVVRRIGQWLRYNSAVWGGLTFSKMVFAGWEFYLSEKNSVALKQQIMTNSIRAALDEDQFQRSKAVRTRTQRTKLYLKRYLVNLVVWVAVLCCYKLITDVNEHHQDISDWIEDLGIITHWDQDISEFVINFVDTLTVWVCGLVLPPLLSALGSLEEYSSRVTMLHFILRSAAVRLISIGTLVVYQLPFGATSSSGTLCWETNLGQKLYAQVMWDLLMRVTGMTFLLLYRVITLPFHLCLTKSLQPEFDIPGKVLDLLSLQTLSWLSVLVSPQLPMFVLVSIYILLVMELVAALYIYRPSKHVFQVLPSSGMFMVVLGVSWVCCTGFTITLVVFCRPSLGCGPFRGLEYSWQALTHFICEMTPSFSWLRNMLFSLDNWYVFGITGLCLVVSLLYHLTNLHINSRDVRRLEQRLLKIADTKASLKRFRKYMEKM